MRIDRFFKTPTGNEDKCEFDENEISRVCIIYYSKGKSEILMLWLCIKVHNYTIDPFWILSDGYNRQNISL